MTTRLLILLCLASIASRAGAVECDTALTPIAGGTAYKPRDKPPRCEGFYISPVSGPAIELVSLTYGPPPGGQPGSLVLSIPRDAAIRSAQHVRATGIPLGMYYRMDAELSPTRR